MNSDSHGHQRSMAAQFASLLLIIAAGTVQTAQSQPVWRELPGSPLNVFRHDDLFFVNGKVGWIVNGTGQIYKTGNGGATWQRQLARSGVYFRCVGFVDSLKGWAGNLGPNCFSPTTTDSTLLFQTDDGGETWKPVTTIPAPRPSGLCGMFVVNDSVIYATGTICGNPGVIKTTNAGETWTSFGLSAHADRLVDCFFFTPDSGLVVGGLGPADSSKGIVLFTADGGNTWEEKYRTSNTPVWCWKISFPTDRVGYVSLETSRASNTTNTFFLKTVDRGLSWEEKPFLTSTSFYWEQGIGFATPDRGWIGGGEQTYETTDGGQQWQVAGFGRNLNRFRMLNDSLGYAVGQRVYKYSSQIATSVESSPQDIPEVFVVAQNYPNPFNPNTVIEYSLSEKAYVTLRIYNVLGQEIRTLIDEAQPAGRRSVEWDGKDMFGNPVSSAVYIYRFQAGTILQYRMMLLLR
ncbi:MAG: FlgD immunoglobulin-like domain containing protein [bacterium]